LTSPEAATYTGWVNPAEPPEPAPAPLPPVTHELRALRQKRDWGWLRDLGSHLVTAGLVLAVAAVLGFGVGPQFLPYKVYTVLSGSMEPTLHVGSVVVLRPAPADQIRTGDIITFQRPDRRGTYITHRVVNITRTAFGPAFVTKGDANGVSDSWTIPVSGTGLKYWFDIPLLGFFFAILESPIGRICFILAPALILAAVTINELWKDEPRPKGA